MGLKHTTLTLKVSCSTDWASHASYVYLYIKVDGCSVSRDSLQCRLEERVQKLVLIVWNVL